MNKNKNSKQRFDLLINTHRAELWRYAYFLCGSVHEAEALIQNACKTGWNNLCSSGNKKHNNHKYRAWLLAILRREFFRRHKIAAHSIEWLEKTAKTADARSSSGEGIDLERSIRDLPALLRIPLLLQVVEGLSIDEISRELNTPQETILTRIARARKRLFASYPAKTWVVYAGGRLAS